MTALLLFLGGFALCLFLGFSTGTIAWLKKFKGKGGANFIGCIFVQTTLWLGFYAFCLLVACSIAFGVTLVV